jgi:hypothetical protein
MKLFLLLPVLFISLFALNSHAQYDHGNGGDMCELRFDEIRTDLQKWLLKGGAENLKLPAGLTLEKYLFSMLDEIKKAKVSCTKKDLFVGIAEKTCKNFIDDEGTSRIVCNYERFLATIDTAQYTLVHHEFAGLAGFEINSGESSNYSISDQISAFLETKIVKQLVVKPAQNRFANPFDPAVCEGEPLGFKNSRKLSETFAEFQVFSRQRECERGKECGPWKKVRNQLPYNDLRVFRGHMSIPAVGLVSIYDRGLSDEVGINLASSDLGMSGQGVYLICDSGTEKKPECRVVAMPYLKELGSASGVITPHCLQLTYKPPGFFATKDFFEDNLDFRFAYKSPMEMPSIWIEQETVFVSHY